MQYTWTFALVFDGLNLIVRSNPDVSVDWGMERRVGKPKGTHHGENGENLLGISMDAYLKRSNGFRHDARDEGFSSNAIRDVERASSSLCKHLLLERSLQRATWFPINNLHQAILGMILSYSFLIMINLSWFWSYNAYVPWANPMFFAITCRSLSKHLLLEHSCCLLDTVQVFNVQMFAKLQSHVESPYNRRFLIRKRRVKNITLMITTTSLFRILCLCILLNNSDENRPCLWILADHMVLFCIEDNCPTNNTFGWRFQAGECVIMRS